MSSPASQLQETPHLKWELSPSLPPVGPSTLLPQGHLLCDLMSKVFICALDWELTD